MLRNRRVGKPWNRASASRSRKVRITCSAYYGIHDTSSGIVQREIDRVLNRRPRGREWPGRGFGGPPTVALGVGGWPPEVVRVLLLARCGGDCRGFHRRRHHGRSGSRGGSRQVRPAGGRSLGLVLDRHVGDLADLGRRLLRRATGRGGRRGIVRSGVFSDGVASTVQPRSLCLSRRRDIGRSAFHIRISRPPRAKRTLSMSRRIRNRPRPRWACR